MVDGNTEPATIRRFSTVFRAYSAVRFPPGEPLHFRMGDADADETTVIFDTVYGERDGVGPWPMFLICQAEASAETIDGAMEDAHALCSGLLSVLAFAANAAVGDLSVEVSFETTRGRSERDFFQLFIERPTIDWADRLCPREPFLGILPAIMGHSEQPRLYRAVQQYRLALDSGTPGDELGAVAHLWMAVEALTTVMLREEIAAVGGSREALLEEWSIDLKRLDAEVRLRRVFQGDADLYMLCKESSDAFEHGFRSYGEVYRAIKDRASEVFRLVRTAILSAAGVEGELFEALTAHPNDTPLGLQPIARQLRAKLITSSDDLNEADRRYPFVELVSTIQSIDHDPDGSMRVSSLEDWRGHFAPGVTLRDVSFSIAPVRDPRYEEVQTNLDRDVSAGERTAGSDEAG
jgi:hypothetical protein